MSFATFVGKRARPTEKREGCCSLSNATSEYEVGRSLKTKTEGKRALPSSDARARAQAALPPPRKPRLHADKHQALPVAVYSQNV